jgi:hypothetical protein
MSNSSVIVISVEAVLANTSGSSGWSAIKNAKAEVVEFQNYTSQNSDKEYIRIVCDAPVGLSIDKSTECNTINLNAGAIMAELIKVGVISYMTAGTPEVKEVKNRQGVVTTAYAAATDPEQKVLESIDEFKELPRETELSFTKVENLQLHVDGKGKVTFVA